MLIVSNSIIILVQHSQHFRSLESGVNNFDDETIYMSKILLCYIFTQSENTTLVKNKQNW